MVIGVWIYVSGYSRSLEIVFYWLMVTALQKKIDYRYLDMRWLKLVLRILLF